MEQQIRELISRHYKRAEVCRVSVDLDRIVVQMRGVKPEWVAKRLLNRYKDIYWVFIQGGWGTWVFSRETLKWLGYGTA